MTANSSYHKIGNLVSHLTATGFGAAAVYNLAEGRTGAAIFDGSMAVLSEVFGYILREHSGFMNKLDGDTEIFNRKMQKIDEQWRQQDEAGQKHDLKMAYLRGRVDMAHEFNARAWSNIDQALKDRQWERWGIKAQDYHLGNVVKHDRPFSLLELFLIPVDTYRG